MMNTQVYNNQENLMPPGQKIQNVPNSYSLMKKNVIENRQVLKQVTCYNISVANNFINSTEIVQNVKRKPLGTLHSIKATNALEYPKSVICYDISEQIDDEICVPMSIVKESARKQSPEKEDAEHIANFYSVILHSDYREDIYQYLRNAEKLHRPRPEYMQKQLELTEQMRAILMDWLVSVSAEYKLNPDTFHLAVTYIDRFLSKMSVVRNKLQLVGVAAMLIAGKFEEIYPPDLTEYVYLTNDTYTINQLVRMEQLMLHVLTFDLSSPTVYTFISEYLAHCKMDRITHKLAMYLSEMSVIEDCSYLHHLPSKVAAAIVALARYTVNEDCVSKGDMWPDKLRQYSGYTLKELGPIIRRQQKIFIDSPTSALQAVNIKYSTKDNNRVSTIKPRVLNLDTAE